MANLFEGSHNVAFLYPRKFSGGIKMLRYESLGTDGLMNFPLDTQPKLCEEKQAFTIFLRKFNKALVTMQMGETKFKQ